MCSKPCFVAIIWSKFHSKHYETSIEFELLWKNMAYFHSDHLKPNRVAWIVRCNHIMLWYVILTHPLLVPHICVSESGQNWFRLWLVAYSAPSHYLNQYWNSVNWTLKNKLQRNFNQNTKLFIHKICTWKYCLRNGDHFVQGGGWVKKYVIRNDMPYKTMDVLLIHASANPYLENGHRKHFCEW